MAQTVVGTVVSVVKGKTFTYKQGPLAGKVAQPYKITVDSDNGQVVVERNGLEGSNFTLAEGTKVQVTYDTTVSTYNGKQFSTNKIVKDGLLLLQDGGQAAPVSSTGAAKPAFVPQGQAKTGGSTYSSEGARNGMIVNASLALATARKDVTLQALLQAANDIKSLTAYVETGESKEEPKKAVKASAIVKTVQKDLPERIKAHYEADIHSNDEDDSPFSL